MMFLLRSVFWLSIAFMVIQPGMDMRETASALSGQALARGSQLVAGQIEAIECDSLTCLGGKAVVSAALQPAPPTGPPMHVLPVLDSVPLPRPRPDRAS
ncbi:MAG: hypothetical protein KIS86_09040 [Devosia sp.]|nr:hypothetical protein [Devosia sp.]